MSSTRSSGNAWPLVCVWWLRGKDGTGGRGRSSSRCFVPAPPAVAGLLGESPGGGPFDLSLCFKGFKLDSDCLWNVRDGDSGEVGGETSEDMRGGGW